MTGLIDSQLQVGTPHGSLAVRAPDRAPVVRLIESMRNAAYWLSLGFVFTIPWENVLQIGGVGTIARFVGLLMAALWIMSQLLGGTVRRPDAMHLATLAFVGWSGLSMFWSIDPDATITQFFTLVQLSVFLLLSWDIYRSPQAISNALRAYVLGAWVTFLVVLANYLSASAVSYEGRVTAGEFNFDTVGMILALGVPVAWYVARERVAGAKWHGWMKPVYYAYIPAGIFGLTLTGTRTALLALFPGAVYMVWSLSGIRLSRRIFTLAFLLAIGLVVTLLAPEASTQRLGTTVTELQSGSFSSRSEIWRQGLDAFVDRPIAGVGAGAFRQAVARGQVAHNTPLSVATETGIIGLILFGLAVAITVRRIGRHLRPERRFWAAMLLGVAIGASSLTWETKKIGWLFLGLAVTSAANAHRARRSTGRGRHMAKTPGRGRRGR